MIKRIAQVVTLALVLALVLVSASGARADDWIPAPGSAAGLPDLSAAGSAETALMIGYPAAPLELFADTNHSDIHSLSTIYLHTTYGSMMRLDGGTGDSNFTNYSANTSFYLPYAGTFTADTPSSPFHMRQRGLKATGFGLGVKWVSGDDTTEFQDMGQIMATWTDATAATKTSKMAIQTVNAGGALADRLVIDSTGITIPGTVGWTQRSGANTACNTTCSTHGGAVWAFDTGTHNPVAVSDATADVCLCAGP